MRVLAKALSNQDKLLGILYADLKYATSQMKAHTGDHSCEQFWRRTAIRALAATVDGMVYCLKQNAIACGQLQGYTFEDEELFFLSEEHTDISKQKRFRLPAFGENLKRTFKFYSKIFNVVCPIDFGKKGFEALCEVYELRSELMHPKSYWDFHVSDPQKQKAVDAITWLSEESNKVIESCMAAF